jgi:hypothetical protein
MIAGDCDGGKKELAEFYRARDKTHRQTDDDIKKTVDAFATNHCPTSKQGDVQSKISHIATRIKHAQERGEAATCKAEAKEIEDLAKSVPADKRQGIAGMLSLVSDCLDELGQCDDARATFNRYFELVVAPGLKGSNAITADGMYRPKKCPKK